MSDERCALVLEGGAMRGMYTAGVLDCFMDHDISFDAVIGVSAGESAVKAAWQGYTIQ